MCHSIFELPRRYFDFDFELHSSWPNNPGESTEFEGWEGEDEEVYFHSASTVDEMEQIHHDHDSPDQVTGDFSTDTQAGTTLTVVDVDHSVDWTSIDAGLSPRRITITQEEINMMMQVNEFRRRNMELSHLTFPSTDVSEQEEEDITQAEDESHEPQNIRVLIAEGDIDALLERFACEFQAHLTQMQLHVRFLRNCPNILRQGLDIAAWYREPALERPSSSSSESAGGPSTDRILESSRLFPGQAQEEDLTQAVSEDQAANSGADTAVQSLDPSRSTETFHFHFDGDFCLERECGPNILGHTRDMTVFCTGYLGDVSRSLQDD